MAETFVLVHGAWHGAWCWAGVMGELRRRGHRAYAVDLPGRPGNPRPHSQVNRRVWVDAVVEAIARLELAEVVLAGHSMGGLTITGVCLEIPERIKRVIYLTALVPPETGSLADEMPSLLTPAMGASMQNSADGLSSTMGIEYFRSAFLQDGSRDLQDFVYAALVPEAMAPIADPVPMRDFHSLGIPASYVICEDDQVFGDPKKWHPGFSGRLRKPSTRVLKNCGHELMFTRPVETAHALIELAAD